MANRVKDIIGLVTVWHPEFFLGCRTSNLLSKPHYIRLRAKSDERREKQRNQDGFEVRQQIMDDGTVREGHGTAVKRYRNTSIRGEQLLPFIEGVPPELRPEPLLIYVKDEETGKSRWKCELRCMSDWRIQFQDLYPDGLESLPETMRLESKDSDVFWATLRASTLRICGLWVNPTSEVGVPNNRCLNLVLGPIQGHKIRPADLRILAEQGESWIEYTEGA